ncbi:unnamed protein product [Effrenium voratum]|uniref:Uncharacterized protein n=1 Tax=Effrenium voratum TaxID=2562239 RepID=A0AA36IVV8_9DINO|nr:unnamed protein product [Effrenium voratum]
MKLLLVCTVLGLAGAVKTRNGVHHAKPAKIVEMLKGMAEKAEADGKAEDETLDKFQCHSKKVISEKATTIANLQELIGSTENRIEKLTALSSELATKQRASTRDLEANQGTQDQAAAARENANKAFAEQEADMAASLASLEKALVELSEVKGDAQAASLLATSSDPKVQEVTRELEAVAEEARDFLAPKALAMLRKPADYEQQSGGVLGTLQSLKDTYAKDLKDLREGEVSDKASHKKLLEQLGGEQAELKKMLEMTEAEIASTKEELVTKRSQLKQAKEDLESESALKAETEKVLAQKTGVYEERQTLRSEEATAIAKAVAVLNSDAAFATFGQVSATSFLQTAGQPKQALALLRRAATERRSQRLGRAAAWLARKATGPFDKVIEEIAAMQEVISDEAKADKKKSDWCAAELAKNADDQGVKSGRIDALNTAITELGVSIEGPVDGLQVTLKQAEEELQQNEKDQEEMTSSRKAENRNYQKKVADLQSAQGLLTKAMKVLQAYYAKLALMQADPSYDEGKYTGQSSAGESVLKLLQTVLDDSAKEESEAHVAEKEAQASFEDGLNLLAQSEEKLRKTIADSSKDIADKKIELGEKNSMLKDTKQEKTSLVQYLADVKPGCDWIKANLAQREANRAAEAASLTKAVELIKGTPAYEA